MRKKKSITRTMCDEAKAFFDCKYSNRNTSKTYKNNYRRFVLFAREKGFKANSECANIELIQKYVDYLKSKGRTPSTIHTCVVSICLFLNIDIKKIEKPKRVSSEFSRGRSSNGKAERSDNDENNPKYAGTVEFQRRVGIRRAELSRLRKEDFVIDESGYACVHVRRGKGGKEQLQRILPENILFIKSYFDEARPGENIFSTDDLKNKLDYHSLRSQNAKSAYMYYLNLIKDQSKKEQLIHELKKRWNKYNINPKTKKPRPFREELYNGMYFLRGKNKQFAIANGLEIKYDKLALLATSIFHLSHWRLGVTVCSYLNVV